MYKNKQSFHPDYQNNMQYILKENITTCQLNMSEIPKDW